RERLDLLQGDVEIEADPALRRPSGGVVEHAVPDVDLHLAAVADDGDGDDDLFLGVTEDFVETGIEVQDLGRVVEALHHRFERVLLRQERVLVRPDQGSGFGCDRRVAHNRRVRVGRLSRQWTIASPPDSHRTASTATSGSRTSAGQRWRSFTASFSVTTT